MSPDPAPAREGGPALANAAILAATVLAADQASKALVNASVTRGDKVALFPGLDLSNVRNTGVAFGFFPGGGDVVSLLSLGAVALLLVYFLRNQARPGLWVPVGLLVGGALGNLVDRLRLGAVVDFIDPARWPAFNLADGCIVVGVIALVYVLEGPPARGRREDSDRAGGHGDGRADAAA